ncbi:MAG: DUF2334 domain-containing protein [Candidatus Woesearchaeota archaeon]|nr:MAG: DUF2334 domain-containing protein [Candidatus Woesearchaeota archaeon]
MISLRSSLNKRNIFLIIVVLVILIFIYLSPSLVNEVGHGCTLDDIHPYLISTVKIEEWVLNHDCDNKVIFVTPFYKYESIENSPEWCSNLKSLSEKYNFEIGLHGYKHEKFGSSCGEFVIPSMDFFKAYKIYKITFQQEPKIWRSPCYRLNIIDYLFIKSKGMKNYGFVNSGETYHPNNLNESWCKIRPSWKYIFNKNC